MRTKLLSRTTAVLLSAAVTVPMMFSSFATTFAASGSSIEYAFSGSSSGKAGYAEGTITFTANSSGKYKLYWADDNNALSGYLPIGEFSLSSGGKGTVKMGYHTAIPANATKIIATTGSLNVSDAACVYDVPTNKRLASVSGDLLYKFSTFSDIHIDRCNYYYVNCDTNLRQGLSYSAKNNSDYIIVSGDCITNDGGPDKEYDVYEDIISKSDFVNPIWESDGNHDLHRGVELGVKAFTQATGTDGSKSGKPYFYKIEEKTGDMFIFMALEQKAPAEYEEFSDEQMEWVKGLLKQNYTKRNIFLVQHSPVNGFGAGDRMTKPYYGGLLNTSFENNEAFKQLLITYPDIIFLSGHTHEDFSMDYNYSDENGEAANMIHTPALVGSKLPDSSDTALDSNGGKGYNCQAYITEVYENEIIFYGVNITKELIYPQYSYIMEGARTSETPVNDPPAERPLKNKTVDISDKLVNVKATLSADYKFASYDAYQAVKKLYYKYKDQTTADESVLDEFDEKLAALAEYTGSVVSYTYYDTYYFVNNKNWSSVYAYAWDGSDKNSEWPGVQLNKCGTKDGYDVYKLAFNKKYRKAMISVFQAMQKAAQHPTPTLIISSAAQMQNGTR